MKHVKLLLFSLVAIMLFMSCSAFPQFVAPKDVVAECGRVPIFDGDPCDLEKIPDGNEFLAEKAKCINLTITARAEYTASLHKYMVCVKKLYDEKLNTTSNNLIQDEVSKNLKCPSKSARIYMISTTDTKNYNGADIFTLHKLLRLRTA